MPKQKGGTLPDIRRYSAEKRQDYLLLIAAVAASDGSMHPDELALLNRWMDSFHLPPENRQAVLATANQAPLEIEAVQRRLAKTDLVYSLMLDMMGMAMADGVLMDKEIALLRDVARSLRFNATDFDILIEFVHSAHQASMLTNPEPLYEHNIESAFQLLRERNVRLFPHTLLCVTSPSYDRELKGRWVRFKPARPRARKTG